MTKTRITLYGGVNEIGGNKFLVEEGDDRILLDFGMSIGARGNYFEEFLRPRANAILRDLLRLDLLPDVDGIYREDMLTVARAATDKDLPESADAWRRRNGGRNFVHGILVTHAHVDHFQDLSFVDPQIPVYCSPVTKGMIDAIQDVNGTDIESEISTVRRRELGTSGKGATFPDRPTVDTTDGVRDIRTLAEQEVHHVGPFSVVPIPVDHSVPGACAFFVKTPSGKRIFYSGDIRFHGRLMDRTSALLKATESLEPDVMLCEGTRIDHDAADNEEGVERGVTELAQEAKGLVVAEFAWKDTTRFDTLQRVASATGRQLLVDPRTAYLLKRLETVPGFPSRSVENYDNVGVYLRRKKSMLDEPGDYEKHEAGYLADWGDRSADMKKAWKDRDEGYLSLGLHHFLNAKRAFDVLDNPDRYIVHLSFWASNELFDLAPPAGSRWIRCSTEPYSDEMAMDLARQRNWLARFGMEHNVKASKADADVLVAKTGTTHVSGHGGAQDILKLIRNASPGMLVPIHTQEKSLDRFAGLAGDVRTFKGRTYANAAKGEVVVEV
ncbi:MAG TPA: MBL fold metallo-hydrolase [Candidatus Thermoplasmatota archaeon]|nr:MBL fold metallo-hydrolase [Candidatus Thermoplasmatota archaeon]